MFVHIAGGLEIMFRHDIRANKQYMAAVLVQEQLLAENESNSRYIKVWSNSESILHKAIGITSYTVLFVV